MVVSQARHVDSTLESNNNNTLDRCVSSWTRRASHNKLTMPARKQIQALSEQKNIMHLTSSTSRHTRHWIEF